MIRFFDTEDDEELGTFDLVDGKPVAEGIAIEITTTERAQAMTPQELYDEYKDWGNRMVYTQEDPA